MGDGIRLVARQTRQDIGKYLAIADLVVSPRAAGKNAPLKVFDYLVAGKPIIATSIRAHRSVLDDSRALFVSRSAASISNGIIRLLEDKPYAERLAAAAGIYARQHLGWERFVCRVGEFADYLTNPGLVRKRAPRAA